MESGIERELTQGEKGESCSRRAAIGALAPAEPEGQCRHVPAIRLGAGPFGRGEPFDSLLLSILFNVQRMGDNILGKRRIGPSPLPKPGLTVVNSNDLSGGDNLAARKLEHQFSPLVIHLPL